MSEAPRRFVLENLLVAGHPMAPSDNDFDVSKLPVLSGPGGLYAMHAFPGIQARLVIALPPDGTPSVRADKLYEVHYHLLALAALSDYEDRTVYYSNRGLATEMGWLDTGPNLKRVRDAVDFLWATTMEFEGNLPDALVPRYRSNQVRSFRILTGRGFPNEEERRSGGRNLSFIQYNPDYLESIKNDPTVQLDVELLSQIPGTLGKAFYRTATWLRAIGAEKVDMAELFERVGSNRQAPVGAHARRFFGGAWELMLRYRYFRSLPEPVKEDNGKWVVHFDWGDPIMLPRKGDALFRAICDAGVNPRVAEQMIRDDTRKIRRIVQAYRAGALSKPFTTPAAQIVGLFKNPEWDMIIDRSVPDQMDLLTGAGSQRFTVEVRPAEDLASADWESIVDWQGLTRLNGDWLQFQNEVLLPVLGAAGEAQPQDVLQIPSLRDRLKAALREAGWRNAVDALYASGIYLRAATRPASYIAAMLENLSVPRTALAQSSAPVPSAAPSASTEASSAATGPGAPEMGRTRRAGASAPSGHPAHGSAPAGTEAAGGLSRARFDLKALEHSHLVSWVDDLERTPNRDIARRALRLVDDRYQKGDVPLELMAILEEIQSRAQSILGEGKTGDPAGVS